MQSAVNFISDGLGLTPSEFAEVLLECTADGAVHTDSYSLGGAVERVEAKFAQLLGKQRSIFMPTGTLANHMALRALAGVDRKVIVQAESHIYRDIGDSAQTLSGLNLMPLAPRRTMFTLQEVQGAIDSFRDERAATRVGVISIESLVRRQNDAMFDYEEMWRISDFARAQDIKMHLDGARLFVEAVHRDIAPAKQAALFDTVFVSLSKCFNSASGAILAGSADFIEDLHHQRRMFGGSLAQAWPQAAVALHYADGFLEAYRAAWSTAETLFDLLDEDPVFRVERITQGTHIVRLHVVDVSLPEFAERLRQRQVSIAPPAPDDQWLTLKINPSILRVSPAQLVAVFRAAL